MSDLVQRLREYARGPGRAASVVSSAWLAREFSVDPRTIAAALRPYRVAPGEVERGVRGYSIAELASIVLPGDDPDPVNHWSAGLTEQQVAATVAVGNVEVPLSELVRAGEAETLRAAGFDLADLAVALVDQEADDGSGKPCRPVPYDEDDPDPVNVGGPTTDAGVIGVLSAAAGHDMTPALRAAGLL